MSNTDKLREIAHKYGGAIITGYGQSSASGSTEMFTAEEQCLSDLTALISEGYVSKEKAGYPLEFIEWLIKDQEIFFGELNEEYILNDNIHVDGRKLQTIDELFNYWKENEQ
jgi:hypothetical protein